MDEYATLDVVRTEAEAELIRSVLESAGITALTVPRTSGQAYTIDKVAPTASIALASGQATPTNQSPINYTVTFSESVTGLSPSGVTIAGTAGGTKTVVVTGSGTTCSTSICPFARRQKPVTTPSTTSGDMPVTLSNRPFGSSLTCTSTESGRIGSRGRKPMTYASYCGSRRIVLASRSKPPRSSLRSQVRVPSTRTCSSSAASSSNSDRAASPPKPDQRWKSAGLPARTRAGNA